MVNVLVWTFVIVEYWWSIGLFDPLQACASYCGIFLAGFYCIFNMAKMEKKKKKKQWAGF